MKKILLVVLVVAVLVIAAIAVSGSKDIQGSINTLESTQVVPPTPEQPFFKCMGHANYYMGGVRRFFHCINQSTW